MSLSLHQISVPVLQRQLKSLQACLDKGEADATARKIDPTVFLTARLAPDMFSLTRQVQLASDFAKGTGARLAAVEAPKYEDTETTFAELRARIAKTQDFLASIKPAQIDGGEAREIELTIAKQPKTLSAVAFLLTYAFPHFFFHVTTAYDILRAQGVALSKADFMGGF